MKYFIGLLILSVVLLCLCKGCENQPEHIIQHDTIQVFKDKIVIQEKEIIRLKEQKAKIIYRTKFDTLATIDTVYVELIKCDSVVKLDSSIIFEQDTIIQEQKKIIGIQAEEIGGLIKQVKKERRKILISKVVAVVGLVLTIFLLK